MLCIISWGFVIIWKTKWHIPGINKEVCQVHAPSQFWEMMEKANMYYVFKYIQHCKG